MNENTPAKNENEKFCSTCGAIINKEAEICPKCGVRQMAQKPQVSDEGAGALMEFICFLFPIIGLILYFVWMDTKPRAAKQAGKWAIISVVLMVVIFIIAVVILAAIGLG